MKKLWKKRLNSAANEAVAELDQNKKISAPKADKLHALITALEKHESKIEKLPVKNKLKIIRKDNNDEGTVLFDALFTKNETDLSIHHNVLSR